MAFALVEATTATGSFAPGMSLTVPETTPGNLLVLGVVYGNEFRTISGATFGGVTGGYALAHHPGTLSGAMLSIHYGICDAAVTSLTVTLSGASSSGGERLTLLEFSGSTDPAAEAGVSTGEVLASTNDHDAASITPSSAENLFVGMAQLVASSGGFTGDADFTDAVTPGSTFIAQYKIQSAATAQAWTVDSVTARASAVALVAFTGESAGGGGISIPVVIHHLQQQGML